MKGFAQLLKPFKAQETTMLSQDILQAIKQYTASMQAPLTFVLQSGEHAKREELKTFLSGIAGTNDLITLEERDTAGALRSPISFSLEVSGQDTGIQFSGIPSGHEFNSLILAVLQSTGTALKLDESLQKNVAACWRKTALRSVYRAELSQLPRRCTSAQSVCFVE